MSDIVQRLYEQAGAGSHRWVDVMRLLLDAGAEIERLRGEYMKVGNELDDLTMSLSTAQPEARSTYECRSCGAKVVWPFPPKPQNSDPIV